MKCPYCGAEIVSGKFCEACGSQITVEMMKEQEQLNKSGCPKCGSSNVSFRRENQGEIRGKKSKEIVHKTVGVCKDCGYTWYPEGGSEKKRKTWLWVLGWIFIFPLPLTLILVKKKDMKPAVKYGIIAAAWVIYLLIGIFGKPADTQQPVVPAETSLVTENAERNASLQEAFAEAMGDTAVSFSKTIKNDTTGNWRVTGLSSSEDIVNHAVEYYKAYFEDDNEVHFVINFLLKTTARFNVYGDQIFVEEYEYVDNEEHNARTLPSGERLKSYIITISTGEIKDITDAD